MKGWKSTLAAFAFCFAFSPVGLRAEDNSIDTIKVGFLYNIAKFVTWPESKHPTNETPIRFVVLGNDTIKKGLRLISKARKIGSRPFEILDEVDPLATHLVFLGKNAHVNLSSFISSLQGKNVLLVSDREASLSEGCHIYVYTERGRLRFKANQVQAKADDLRLEAKLLSLAHHVIR